MTLPGKSESLTSSLKVKVNQYASLDCLVAGAGQDSLHWFLADVKKDATGESEKTDSVTKSNVKFLVSSDHNGKEIRCDVVNLAGSAPTVVASANLGIESKICLFSSFHFSCFSYRRGENNTKFLHNNYFNT